MLIDAINFNNAEGVWKQFLERLLRQQIAKLIEPQLNL